MFRDIMLFPRNENSRLFARKCKWHESKVNQYFFVSEKLLRMLNEWAVYPAQNCPLLYNISHSVTKILFRKLSRFLLGFSGWSFVGHVGRWGSQLQKRARRVFDKNPKLKLSKLVKLFNKLSALDEEQAYYILYIYLHKKLWWSKSESISKNANDSL